MMGINPPAIQWTSEGHIGTLKITIFGPRGDWVEHFARVDMSDFRDLSADDIGARYVGPALEALANRIYCNRELVV